MHPQSDDYFCQGRVKARAATHDVSIAGESAQKHPLISSRTAKPPGAEARLSTGPSEHAAGHGTHKPAGIDLGSGNPGLPTGCSSARADKEFSLQCRLPHINQVKPKLFLTEVDGKGRPSKAFSVVADETAEAVLQSVALAMEIANDHLARSATACGGLG
jgi:hypothetical protein